MVHLHLSHIFIFFLLTLIVWKLSNIELMIRYIQSDVRKIKKNLEDK